ncbi:hypothetical protein [Xanthomonas campestris]|uniref:hypothetical protein n=1 Tax=Xanthomonas campestris TaxID=339 RepID=UPI0039C08139
MIDGTFDSADGRDLSEIAPGRGLITDRLAQAQAQAQAERDRLAQAEQAPAESSVRQVSERSIEQKKKKSKWWKKF